MNLTEVAPAVESRRRNLTMVAGAALCALALVFFMVSSVTSAAWTDTTRNDGNTWATGAVSLTDTQAGTAIFTTSDALLVPGSSISKSITVVNESTVPLGVRLYGASLDDTDLLAQHLGLTVGSTVGGNDVFTGTLADFASTHVAYGSGTTAIELAAANAGDTDQQTYYFTVTLAAAAPASAQGNSAGIAFVWEGQTL